MIESELCDLRTKVRGQVLEMRAHERVYSGD